MASEGKNGRDDGPALGWDLFKWRWVTEPPEGLTAAVYGILFILFFLIAISGALALWQLLAPIWTGASSAAGSAGTDPGADLRGRLLVIGALLGTTPFLHLATHCRPLGRTGGTGAGKGCARAGEDRAGNRAQYAIRQSDRTAWRSPRGKDLDDDEGCQRRGDVLD
jgi:hypothetical protein